MASIYLPLLCLLLGSFLSVSWGQDDATPDTLEDVSAFQMRYSRYALSAHLDEDDDPRCHKGELEDWVIDLEQFWWATLEERELLNGRPIQTFECE